MFLKYFGPSCLAGISLTDWLLLLGENGFHVSPRYWGKVPFLTLSSVVTTGCKAVEDALYATRLRDSQPATPIFILGCWRSGTTHLHNLLTLDPRFSCPSMFQTMYPHTFLTNEWWLRPLLELLTPRKRFMDNMEQSLREPHEDEMALAIMTRRSNMLSWTFPRRAEFYDQFLDFTQASPADRQRWKQALDLFVRKISLKTGKHVVLKSPNHTARIALLLELYPQAKFLHIKRHPCDVFRSMCHMASQVMPVWGLQYFPPEDIPNMVIETYARLYNAYLDQRSLVPAGQLHEISYEELSQQPVETLATAYDRLSLGDFEQARSALEAYTQAKSSYQKNKHREIPPEQLAQLQDRWQRMFEEFGYSAESR